jgi:hypothetical protein
MLIFKNINLLYKGMAGKGDKPRSVKKKVYDTNFDGIAWSPANTEIRPCTVKKGKKIYKYP